MMLPIEPKQEDCCNSGCNPCIFDVYQKQLLLYNRSLESGDTAASSSLNGISQLEYTEFLLVNSFVIGKNHKILFFSQSSKDDNLKVRWSLGDYFLLKYTINNKTCSRAYTPLQPKYYKSEKSDFCIVVKRYNKGMISNYLFNLSPGQITLWRGPYGSYEIAPNKYNNIIMIAQGTGILPFISIIDHILENEEDYTKIILYYCCENSDAILFRDKLYEDSSYWNFSYKIFLSKSTESVQIKYLEPIFTHKLSMQEISHLLPISNTDQFLLCGSAQFMNHYLHGLQELGINHTNIKRFE